MATPVVPMSTSVLSKSVDAAIRKYFVDEYKEHPAKLEALYKIEKQENRSDEMTGFTGLSGTFSEIGEGETYPEDTSIATYNTNFTVSKRGVTESITWEMSKWGRDKRLTDSGKKLAKAARRDIGKQAGGQFTGGFSTPAATMNGYGDTKNLFSISHTRANGGTAQSNASASGITLNEANLWTGMIALQNQLDDRGETLECDATSLVVPMGTSNYKDARILLESEARPETSDNDMNMYDGLLKLVGWKYISSASTGTSAHDNYWYLLDTNSNPLCWQWGSKPFIERDDSVGFKNKVVYYMITYERARGWVDWRGIWASKGDDTSYAS